MRILVADDDIISRRILESYLRKWDHELEIAEDGQEAWDILSGDNPPRLAIMDWMMPVYDGIDICRMVRSMEDTGYIYLILLTSRTESGDIVEGLEAGADDYVTKPFNGDELKLRVKIGERILTLEQQLFELASHDALTGMLNRRFFNKRLQEEINRSKRQKAKLGLIICDIDHFKKVNDTYGHQTGDNVIQYFAECLDLYSRTYDTVGRFGGEEFTICCPGSDVDQTARIAERLRQEVSKMNVPIVDSPDFCKITASFGVSSIMEDFDTTPDELIGRADQALYLAKEDGRNKVCTYFEGEKNGTCG